ncbi:MAG: 2-C-methyl-D-erythritol 4-phosphate cytidylyltransferase [Chitinophagaceae bacterium]
MKKYAVIVAGGIGKRMNNDMPKQFLPLHDKPVLYYTLKAFIDAFADIQIILVLPPEHIALGEEILDAWFDRNQIKITAGGETRFHSVKNGLDLIEDEGIIFVHDGVRCLVTPKLITYCYDTALEYGTAIPVLPSKDSVRIQTETGTHVVDRNNVLMVQTPQTFHSKILLPAFNIEFKEKFTDEASVVEAYGIQVKLMEGEDINIKLTRPVDMLVAEQLIKLRMLADSKA